MSHHQFRLRHNLAALLEHRGMTAAELSRATGVAKQVLSDWMAGVQPRKLEQLCMVAQTLGVSIDSLCFADSSQTLIQQLKPVATGGRPKDINTLQELKGRYEVVFRRISDD
jgi:transcriptional regulator with XRE-family HTH domain